MTNLANALECAFASAPLTGMQVADLDGLAHYKALGISKSANEEAIKKASEALMLCAFSSPVIL